MKKTLLVHSVFDQPELLENLVEKLACRRYDIGYGNEKVPVHLQALETSSTQTYASGAVIFSGEDDIHMPFITEYLFTCIKAANGSYKLTWASSLS